MLNRRNAGIFALQLILALLLVFKRRHSKGSYRRHSTWTTPDSRGAVPDQATELGFARLLRPGVRQQQLLL
jgi:hypothetical protein